MNTPEADICTCGHKRYDHYYDWAVCAIVDCECLEFTSREPQASAAVEQSEEVAS
jgi:hypothetical protein